MEEFLSQRDIPFELRDVMVDPLTPDELWLLIHDAQRRQLAPITKILGTAVMGYDPIRLEESFEQYPEARGEGVIVYGRRGDPGTDGMLDAVTALGATATLVDVDQHPLSIDELWTLLEIPGRNIRTPLTQVNETVVLGNDRLRLEQVLAEEGYV